MCPRGTGGTERDEQDSSDTADAALLLFIQYWEFKVATAQDDVRNEEISAPNVQSHAHDFSSVYVFLHP